MPHQPLASITFCLQKFYNFTHTIVLSRNSTCKLFVDPMLYEKDMNFKKNSNSNSNLKMD
jgi:hypothetical protein